MVFALAGIAGAIPTIMVFPSVAPNAFGSPSYNDYVTNAIFALENGLSSYGLPGTPAYYQQVSNITTNQMIVTGFPSWLGQADPGTVFGAPYANELGNRPLFGLVVNGNGTQISIGGLGFSAFSNDPGNLLGFGFGTGGYNYNSNYVGVIFGSGGPTFVTSGPNTQLVDQIIGRGSGNADAAYCPGCTVAQQQAAIDALAADFAGMTQFSGTYTLTAPGGGVLATGGGTFNVSTTPEPATLPLLGIGVLGIVVSRIRRKS